MGTDEQTFEKLVADLTNPVCQIEDVHEDRKCTRKSTHMVVWLEKCLGGAPLVGPTTTALCKGHLRELLMSIKAGNLMCSGCDQVVKDLNHGIVRIEAL